MFSEIGGCSMTKVMKSAAILTLLTFQLALPATALGGSPPQTPSDLTVRFEKIQNPNSSDEPYTIAVIRPRVQTEVRDQEDHLFAKQLLSTANDWFFDQLLTRYKHANPEELAAKLLPMKAEGIHLTAQSSFIIVFKNTDLRKPVGTLWFYYPDENGQIDLQAALDSNVWKYPVPEVKVKSYPRFVLKDGAAVGVEAPSVQTGGVIELKRLAIDPRSPRELLISMLMRGESYDRLSAKPFLNSTQQTTVMPAEYALRCNHALVPVYKRLGLELVPNHPSNEANEDYVMRINRTNYVDRVQRMLESARESGWDIRYRKSDPVQSKTLENDLRSKMCRNLFAS